MIEPFIHSSADVSPTAKIANGTKVWNLAQIRDDAEIGSNCTISRNAYVGLGVKIGDGVKIHNNASVYCGTTIEDEVLIGPGVTFTNFHTPRASVALWEKDPTLVKKAASIGAHAVILPGIEIGEYAMVGAGAVVTKNVPAHALVYGNPAKIINYVCFCGEKINKEMKCEKCESTIELSTK